MANESLKAVGARLVVEGGDEFESRFKAAELAAKGLSDNLRLGASLAKEFGISANEASRLVNTLAEQAGTTFEVYARSLLETAQREKEWAAQSQQNTKAVTQAEQEAVVAASKASQDYVTFWQEALKEKERLFEADMEKQAAMGQMGFRPIISGGRLSGSGGTGDNGISGSGLGFVMYTNEEAEALRKLNEAKVSAIDIQNEYFASQQKSGEQTAKNIALSEEDIAAIKKIERANAEYILSLKERQREETALKFANEEEVRQLSQRAQLLVESGIAFGASSKEMQAGLQGIGYTAREAKEILQQYGVVVEDVGKKQGFVSERSIHASRAFFALTLASFGLMSITQELKKSFGDELPDAFEKTSSAVQQIASFGSAGAFIGGGPGAILGGIAGGLIAATTAALTLDPALQRLNQDLDNMSNKDESVQTLMDIAGISEDVAKTWLDAAQKDPNFAAYLETVVKKAEPIPGLLATINDLVGRLNGSTDSLGKSFGEMGDTANKALILIYAGLIGFGEAITIAQEALAKGPLGLIQTTPEEVADNWGRINTKIWEAIENITKATQKQNLTDKEKLDISRQANDVLGEQQKISDKLVDAQNKLADATEKANEKLKDLERSTAADRLKAVTQYEDAVADAHRQFGNAYESAEQQRNDRLADLWQDLADKKSDIELNLQQKLADIDVQLANRLEDIGQQLSDRIADINQSLQNKLADLDHDRVESVNKANQKIQDAARDLARKLYEIERDRQESLEALAFSTHEQLMDARTDHDKDRILRRSQFEQAQINQKANDDRRDALTDYQDKVKQAEQEKRLAKDTYDYQVDLAKRLAAQQMAEAQHTADVQVHQAQRQAAQQKQTAEREAQDQINAADRRYKEEVAIAQRAFHEQVAAASRAEQQKLDDAVKALDARNKAIAESYALERAEIQATKIAAYEAFIEQLKQIGEVALAYSMMLKNLNDNYGELGKKLFLGNGAQPGIEQFTPLPPSLTHGAHGMNMTVPEGYNNDSYPIFVSSGEHVVVTPPGGNSTSQSMVNNIYIYDATDPRKVGEVVRKELTRAVWR